MSGGAAGPLRIGVMGCASIARRVMVPAMLRCAEVEVAAVASRSAAKAAALAEAAGCRAHQGYAALLADPDVDAVYVPLPTGLHEEWVGAALRAGKHALVEKSFALDAASAERLVRLAQAQGRLLVENFLFPHHSRTAWALRFLATGEIGELRSLRTSFCIPPRESDDVRYVAELGGGALYDLGTYGLRAARLFLGEELRVVRAELEADPALGVDLFGTAELENARGQTAHATFGIGRGYECSWELVGTRGRLVLERAFTAPPDLRPTVRIERAGAGDEVRELPADDYCVNLLRHFAAGVPDPGVHAREGEEILRQSRLLDAVRAEAFR